MNLTHKPAHTSDSPDRFEDEETGWGYIVRQDIDAEDPRSWVETEHAALWVYNEPSMSHSVAAEKPEGNFVLDAFARFYATMDEDTAFATTVRWLNVFHPDSTMALAMQTIRGYSQGDWLDVICAVEDGYGTPESHINQFRQWAFGDVWVVIPDWTSGISGIYAADAAEALKYFRENFEDDPNWVDKKIAEEEAANKPLDPQAAGTGPWRVSWEIDGSEEATSALDAAYRVWVEIFGRTFAAKDDACVFTVTDTSTGRSAQVDLSDYDTDALFDEYDNPA